MIVSFSFLSKVFFVCAVLCEQCNRGNTYLPISHAKLSWHKWLRLSIGESKLTFNNIRFNLIYLLKMYKLPNSNWNHGLKEFWISKVRLWGSSWIFWFSNCSSFDNYWKRERMGINNKSIIKTLMIENLIWLWSKSTQTNR